MDIELLNGNPKCTLIENFKGEVTIVRPGFRREFDGGLKEAVAFVTKMGWEISVAFIKSTKIERDLNDKDMLLSILMGGEKT